MVIPVVLNVSPSMTSLNVRDNSPESRSRLKSRNEGLVVSDVTEVAFSDLPSVIARMSRP